MTSEEVLQRVQELFDYIADDRDDVKPLTKEQAIDKLIDVKLVLFKMERLETELEELKCGVKKYIELIERDELLDEIKLMKLYYWLYDKLMEEGKEE